jgi:hypothetical protein
VMNGRDSEAVIVHGYYFCFNEFRPSELPFRHASVAQLEEFALQRAFFVSRMRVQVGAALAKADAAQSLVCAYK